MYDGGMTKTQTALSAASLTKMQTTAQATGRVFYLGVRPHDGSLFVGLEPRGEDKTIEYDCSSFDASFDQGVDDVVAKVRDQFDARLRAAETEAKQLRASLGEM